jgi:hypothetical protein
MAKKLLIVLTLVVPAAYMAGRYDLWWIAVIYSSAVFWLFYLKK